MANDKARINNMALLHGQLLTLTFITVYKPRPIPFLCLSVYDAHAWSAVLYKMSFY